MITLRTSELQAASIPDNCAEAAGDVETYAVKPRRTDVNVQLVSVGWAPYWQVGYSSPQRNVTHDRVRAWAPATTLYSPTLQKLH